MPQIEVRFLDTLWSAAGTSNLQSLQCAGLKISTRAAKAMSQQKRMCVKVWMK